MRQVDVEDLHARARHHGLVDPHLGGGDGALDDRQRFGVEQLALVRRLQQLQQLLAVFGFAQEERGNAFVQTRFVRVHWTGGWLREKGLSATGAQRAPGVPAAEA